MVQGLCHLDCSATVGQADNLLQSMAEIKFDSTRASKDSEAMHHKAMHHVLLTARHALFSHDSRQGQHDLMSASKHAPELLQS